MLRLRFSLKKAVGHLNQVVVVEVVKFRLLSFVIVMPPPVVLEAVMGQVLDERVFVLVKRSGGGQVLVVVVGS